MCALCCFCVFVVFFFFNDTATTEIYTLSLHDALPISYTLEQFERSLPDIRARGDSMFMYLFPFNRELNVEFRSYGEGPAPAAAGWRWGVRNYFWASVLPYVGYVASRYLGWKRLRYFAIDAINRFIIFLMRIIMKAESTSA